MASETSGNTDIQTAVRLADNSIEILTNTDIRVGKGFLTDRIVAFLGRVVSLKSSYTANHSNNVKNLALELALRVGFRADELKSLGYAAVLHDIGKIVIKESITDKPAQLTKDECHMMKQHVLFGYEIIQPLGLDPLIGEVVFYHHESYDGSGYLAGMKGDVIPLAARIVKIADTFDALTSIRPYRAAYSPAQAIHILKEERHHFDPFLLDEFLKWIEIRFGTTCNDATCSPAK